MKNKELDIKTLNAFEGEGPVEYYSSSFLLSTTTNFSQANKFSDRTIKDKDNNSIIIFGWIPRQYEGVLSAPNWLTLKSKINFNSIGLPYYRISFFPNQQEITLKGGLLPHYILGYLHDNKEGEVFEINPALFDLDDSWNGIELSIDQTTFHQRIQNTLFGRYFTVEHESMKYKQHSAK